MAGKAIYQCKDCPDQIESDGRPRRCPGCGSPALVRIEDEPEPCGLCQRRRPLAPGRTICEDCAFFPLD